MASIEEKVLEEAYSVTPNFDVDNNDKRITQVEGDEEAALTENDLTYAGMIHNTDKFYDAQIKATEDWADKQAEIQNEQTDFAIQKIEQQKDQAHKDYLKEQSGAYVDWQKQSNQYGVEAEKMASAGLTGTGFAESSQVSMYNTYQNRVATARESIQRAFLEYGNMMKDARMQNSARLAEIAYESLQKSLELSLQGFQYKNQLIIDQANKKLEIKNMYWNQYQDVLDQINAENSIKADIWKYQDSQKWQTEENVKDRAHDEKLKNLEIDYQKERDRLNREHDLALEEARTENEKELANLNHANAMAKLEQEYKNDIAILNQELANEKALYSYKNSVSSAPISSSSGSKGVYSITAGNKSIAEQAFAPISNTSSSGNAPVNAQSVMALGYGAINGQELNRLEEQGLITSYVKNGQTYFKKTNPSTYYTSKFRR